MVNFGEEISDFQLCCGHFSLKEIEAFSRILNWAPNERNIFSLPDQSLEARVSEVSPWRVMVISAEGRILGEGMRCLADIEVRSAKTEECDF